MFRPVPMVHLQAQIPHRDAARATRAIAKCGLLHLVDLAYGRASARPTPAAAPELLGTFRELVRRIRRAAALLGTPLPEPAGTLAEVEIDDFAAEARRLDQRLAPLEARLEELRRAKEAGHERLDQVRQRLALGTRLAAAGVDASRLAALRFVTVHLGLLDRAQAARLAGLLAPVPFALIPLDTAPRPLWAVSVPISERPRLEQALRAVPFEPVPAPPQGPEEWDPARLAQQHREADEAARRAADLLERARVELRPVLAALAARAEAGVWLLQAMIHFAVAGRFVIVSGWIPADAVDRIRRALEEATGGRAVVTVESPETTVTMPASAVTIPILYRNPLLLRPFQKLVGFYGTPRYQEVEPTAFFAASFLVMFGLMFGDVGHGLVLLSAGYYLFRYVPRYLDYGLLLMECGASSSVFGLLYGSLFGVEGLLPVVWLSPLRDLPRFMTVAVLFGIGLLTLGLGLNIVNAWRAGQRASAIFGRHGLVAAVAYWVLLALAVRAFVPSELEVPGWLTVALALAALGLLACKAPLVRWLEGEPARPRHPGRPRWLAALEGAVELVDALFGYFANTISFVRIAAFGAVHAGAFVALFALSETLARLEFGEPLAWLSLIAGNVVIILLEGLTVSVQVLRLEYYEFFGKFFRGGGEPYRPLQLQERTGGDT